MDDLSKETGGKGLRGLFALPTGSFRLALMFAVPFTVVFIILLISIILWEKKSHESDLMIELRDSARAYFEQILITRLWNARHGGIYVKVAEETPPNPYLSDDPERDIISVAGKKYTKMNPAYIMRQISDLAKERGRYKFHITSLRPLNEVNAPDGWETQQLQLFDKGGKTEAYEIVRDDGGERFRYIAPLFVEDACLKCHQKQGYKKDDVRGGISIEMPIDVPKSTSEAFVKRNIMAFGIIGLTSLSFIIGITCLLSKRIARDMERELEHGKLKAAILLAGATAHELRQPMTVVIGTAEIIKDKISRGEAADKEIDVMIQQIFRIDEIIKKMLKITQYKLKTYTSDVKIFDLLSQGEKKEIEKE